jgi:hypothetical protein
MVDIALTQARIQPAINTPFRAAALFVTIVLSAIILINAS